MAVSAVSLNIAAGCRRIDSGNDVLNNEPGHGPLRMPEHNQRDRSGAQLLLIPDVFGAKQPQISNPTERISSSALLLRTTPGRIR